MGARPRIRQHVNPLATRFAEMDVTPPRLPRGGSVELEIGCADAQFLFERAAVKSGCYIGLEIREELVHAVNQQARAAALPIEAIFCHANLHLERLFAPGRVDRVFLNFPDPCFKKRHRKRRMIDDGLGRAIHRVLAPEGELFFQSDVWEVALAVMDVFERLDSLFANQAGPWSFWKHGNPYGAKSWRERYVEGQSLPVWRLLYRPRPGAVTPRPAPSPKAPAPG